MIQNKDLNKWNLYDKDQLIHYEKQNNFEVDSLSNQKDNFKKCIDNRIPKKTLGF
jgi:hypothetical protein